MMPLVDRKHVRDLWAIRGRIIALCLIIASGIGMYLGTSLAIADLRRTQAAFLDAMGFADLEIAITPEDTHNLPAFDQPGIVAQDRRLVYPASILAKDGAAPLAGLAIFQSQAVPQVNRVRVLAGRQFRPGMREVVIDRSLAVYHGYRVGDRLRLKVGQRVYDDRIVGIVLSPEFVISTANPDYVVAKPGSLGVVWSDIGEVSDAVGFTMVDSLLFRFAPGESGAAARAAVLQTASRLDIQKITPRSESYSVKMVAMNLTAFAIYSPAIVWTLCGLSFAMGIITFRRFAIEKRADFAILLSIGVTRRAILASLLRIGMAIGLVGGLVGFGLGLLLGRGFSTVYAAAMHLPPVEHSLAARPLVEALLLGMLCGGVSIALAVGPLLRHSPRNLLQFRAPARDGGSAPSWLGRLPLVARYSVRALLRDRGRTIAAVAAMACSIGVAISYGIAMTSTLQTVDENFAVERWTHAVDFEYPIYRDESDAALGALAGRAEPYLRGALVVRHGDAQQIAQMAGIRIDGRLRRQAPREGRAIAASGEVVISADLARELGVGLGAMVRLEKTMGRRDSRVVGISNDQYLQTVTLSLADAQALAQAGDKVSGAFLVAAPATGNALVQREPVARVTEKADLLAFFAREMRSKLGIVYIAIMFSVGTSILFIATLAYLGILESRADYAILRSLGFARRTITTTILIGVGVQVGLAIVIGALLAPLIADLLNRRMAAAWFDVRLYAGVADFGWPILAVLPIAPLVGWLGARAIMRLNIPAFLRERSI